MALLTLEESFVAQLLGYDPIVDLCDDRVYGPNAPAGANYPRLRIQRISSGDPFQTHSGPSGTERGRWQVSADALSNCEAIRGITYAINCLDGFKGKLGGAAGVRIGRLARQDRRDLGRDPDSKVWTQQADFYVLSQESL